MKKSNEENVKILFWIFVIGTIIYGIYYCITEHTILTISIIVLVITTIITVKIIKSKKAKKNKINKNTNHEETIIENNDCTSEEKTIYQKKKLMTLNEENWYNEIQRVLPTKYILQPQVNLATIIEKTDNSKYANELFRNIDFGIFDTYGNVIVLIEINDSTHKQRNRIARDYKVKEILEQADIPLITFWTEYGINQAYIEKRLKEYI